MRFAALLPRSRRSATGSAVVLVLAVAGLTAAATHDRSGPRSVAVSPATTASGDAPSVVAALQQRLRAHPRDAQGWASLGLGYVEMARVTADPTYYPRADRALARAARIAPRDVTAIAGRATLAAARHEFSAALRLADRALAEDGYAAQALAVRADALTELGRYPQAGAAAEQLNDLKPSASTFARLSYQDELHGHLASAARWMERARQSSSSPSSYAFAAFHAGELARLGGHRAAAARFYGDALRADSTYVPALAGRARIAVATGDLAAAERDYRAAVDRLPLTEYVLELGELYAATGRPGLAAQQWSVARASARLAAANGVVTDLETALFEADHGSAAAAVRAARQEWGRRHSVHVADALGWALHASGRDREALRYARSATRLGTQDARLLFHRGAIEAGLGLDGAARRHLARARQLDDGVSPWREQHITRQLDRLGAR